MKTIGCGLKGFCLAAGGWMLLAALTACTAILHDDESDCTPHYRICIRYDRNLKFADAAATEVKSVSLYVFHRDGTFLKQVDASAGVLAANGYTLPVELQPGEYRVVAWAGLAGHDCFSVPPMTPGASVVEDLVCTMRSRQRPGQITGDMAMPNALFHAYASRLRVPDTPGIHTDTLGLTKNTNRVRVMLQASGGPIDIHEYEFTITASNEVMGYDNALQGQWLTYRPWWMQEDRAVVTEDGAAVTYTGVVADFTVGRLVKGDDVRLNITHQKSRRILLSVPLIDYALMVKGNYRRKMSDQEYLDRQDEYVLTFFLMKDERPDAPLEWKWNRTSLIINGWALKPEEASAGEVW